MMNAEEWQKRLEQNFTENGVVGGGLLELMEQEQSYGALISNNFHGYLLLADSFQLFHLRTLQIAQSQRGGAFGASPHSWYDAVILLCAVNFRTLRAAETVFLRGYPLAATGLLRDAKDRALFLGAIAGGSTTYRKVFGLDQLTDQLRSDHDAYRRHVRQHRKKEQARVFDFMLRKNSGLHSEHLEELALWEDMFHMEVHGARLTTSLDTFRWLERESSLPLSPDFDPESLSIPMYMNRSFEISWMLLRTLPYLQARVGSFGSEWSRKWGILDESLKDSVANLASKGIKVASAIIHLIETKFPFSPSTTHYRELPD